MRRITNNKKAKLFLYISVLGFIIALVSFFFFTFKYQVDKETGYLLGESSVEVINAYRETEELNLYLDFAAKNSMRQTIYDVSKRGGLFTKLCAQPFGEYNYWRKQGRECYPGVEEVQDSIKGLYANNLRQYLDRGPESINLDYELSIVEANPLNAKLMSTALVSVNTTKTYEDKEGTQQNLTVSVMLSPATRIKLSYDLETYNYLSNKSKQLFEDCRQNENLEACIEDQVAVLNNETTTTGFTWSSDCDSKAEHLFYGVLEFLETCLESNDNNCLCTYDLAREEQEITRYDLKGQYNFDFPTANKLLKLSSGTLELESFLDDASYEVDYPLALSLTYSDDELEAAKLGFDQGHYVDVEKLYLQKEKDEILNKNFIRFLQEMDDNYYDEHDNQVVPGDECAVEKKVHRVCVEDGSAKMLSYDKLADEFGFRNPETRFAFQFPDEIPPPKILTLGVSDKEFAEQSMFLEWDAVLVRDLDHYNIYCSLEVFTEASSELKTTELGHNPDLTSHNFTLTQCRSNNLTDLTDYYIAVTAVDTSGNENKEVIAVLGVSVDDLPPDYTPELEASDTPGQNNSVTITWTVPETNADGTTLTDVSSFEIRFSQDQIPPDTPLVVQMMALIAEELGAAPGSSISYEVGAEQGIMDGSTFCFVVIPYDEAGNPKPSDPRAYDYNAMQKACGESINTDNE